MGIRTPVSTNLASALGGLRRGVTAAGHGPRLRDVRHGRPARHRLLSPGQSDKQLPVPGPVGIERIEQGTGKKAEVVKNQNGKRMVNKRKRTRCSSRPSPRRCSRSSATCVKEGTAERAQIPGVMVAGKTGTTESYGDAWFVGWTKEYTVAVWVGYPDKFKPMETEFQGEPVAGGTFPTSIWKTFMMSLLKIDPLPKDDGGDGRMKPTPTPSGVVPNTARSRRPRPPRRPRRPPPTAPAAARRRPPQNTTPPATEETARDEEPPATEQPPTSAGRAATDRMAAQGDGADGRRHRRRRGTG